MTTTDLSTDPRTVDRRRFIRDAATVAWATPVLLTVMSSPAGAQAVSCIPKNSPCSLCDEVPCCDVPGNPPGGCCCGLDPDVDCSAVCSGDSECEDTMLMFCYVSTPPSAMSARSSGKKVKKY